MKPARITILIVDDDPGHRGMLTTLLADWGFRVEAAADGETAVARCREQAFDLILMDVRMAGISGIEALREIKAYNPAIPILIMTAYSDVETAVEAIKAGAYDYLTKPLDFEDLRLTMERALDHAALRDENRTLRQTLAASFDTGGIIGQSPPMRRLMEMLATIGRPRPRSWSRASRARARSSSPGPSTPTAPAARGRT
jgi:two-component system response regulator HydG